VASEHSADRMANEVLGRVRDRHGIDTPRQCIAFPAHAAHVDVGACVMEPGAPKTSSIICAISRGR
jgi:hypothetical protein